MLLFLKASNHLFRPDRLVVLRFGQVAQLEHAIVRQEVELPRHAVRRGTVPRTLERVRCRGGVAGTPRCPT